MRKLEGWERSVAIRLKDVGVLSFRFKKNHFQRLTKPPKLVDIEFSTDLETYMKVRRGVVQWEDGVKTGKLKVVFGVTDALTCCKTGLIEIGTKLAAKQANKLLTVMFPRRQFLIMDHW